MQVVPAMIPYEEACQRVARAAWRLSGETVPLAEARGRVLAADVCSDVDMPPFNKSSMDGYACRAADAARPLRVLEHIPAGRVPTVPVTGGTCSKVMTGAPIPEGADCVLIVEEVETLPDGWIRFTGQHIKSNICAAGEDVRAGDTILRAGTRLHARHLPILASAGCARPIVARRPRVAVMATGDELVPPEAVPGAGQIRNSNSVQLTALAVEAGAEVRDFGIIPDHPEAMKAAWNQALAEADVVISTGGVSMGDFDLVPGILAAAGFEVQFDRVAIQPGKPIQFATRGNQACFGLSGNPVSSFLQFLLFTGPFLRNLQGNRQARPSVTGTLGETLSRRNAGRMGWIPVHLRGDGLIWAVPFHGSAHINAFSDAAGLVAFPPGVYELESGAQVPLLLLDV